MISYPTILAHDIIALITILNPIAAASIMVTMVTPPTPETIRPVAFKATLTVVIASLITLYTGELIFKLFGISVLSLKVIGGIILMLIAINMAYGQGAKSRHTKEEQDEGEGRCLHRSSRYSYLIWSGSHRYYHCFKQQSCKRVPTTYQLRSGHRCHSGVFIDSLFHSTSRWSH